MEIRQRHPAREALPGPPAPAPRGILGSAQEKLRSLACRFGFGLAAGAAAVPVANRAIALLQSAGLFPQLKDRASLLRESVAKLAKMNVSLNPDAILQAACPMKEYVAQINAAFPELGTQTTASVKTVMAATAGVAQPILEETFFRGIFQHLILNRLCTTVISWASPEQAAFLQSTAGKVLRVVMAAGFFAVLHLGNGETMPDSYVAGQASSAFLKGLFYGALQESGAGLPATIGAHIANNLIAMAPHLMSC